MNYKATVLFDYKLKEIVDYISQLHFIEGISLAQIIYIFSVNEINIEADHDYRQWAIKYIRKMQELKK